MLVFQTCSPQRLSTDTCAVSLLIVATRLSRGPYTCAQPTRMRARVLFEGGDTVAVAVDEAAEHPGRDHSDTYIPVPALYEEPQTGQHSRTWQARRGPTATGVSLEARGCIVTSFAFSRGFCFLPQCWSKHRRRIQAGHRPPPHTHKHAHTTRRTCPLVSFEVWASSPWTALTCRQPCRQHRLALPYKPLSA